MKSLLKEMEDRFKTYLNETDKPTKRWRDNDGDRNEESVNEAFYSSNPIIERLVGLFGYRQGIAEFLDDNPGAVDALLEWILSIKDFRDQIKKEFSKEEAENMGIYDLEDDDDLDESNTGAIQGYNTPKAFGKMKKKDVEQLGYKKVQEAMDSKYEQLIESYRDFVLGDPKLTTERKVKKTIKDIAKRLQEIETLVEYNSKLKTESGVAASTYGSSTQKALSKISERLIKISERVRSLGE